MSASSSASGISVIAVSATSTVRPRDQRHRDADEAVAGLGVDDAAHVLERGREVAGDAGHHGVGVAERHHAGGEDGCGPG